MLKGTKKKLKSDERALLDNVVEEVVFVCGEFLYNHNDPKFQKLKEAKVSVDRRQLCQDPQSSFVYKTLEPNDPVVCAWCLNPLPEEKLQKIREYEKQYNTVIPCCCSSKCLSSSSGVDGGFIKAYPKKKRKGASLVLSKSKRNKKKHERKQDPSS